MFDPGARTSGGAFCYYQSEDVFVGMVERVTALGMTDIGLYFPMLEKQFPMFERIARNVIPQLKSEHAAKTQA